MLANVEIRLINVEMMLINVETRLIKVEMRLIKVEIWLLNVEMRLINVETRLIDVEMRLIKVEIAAQPTRRHLVQRTLGFAISGKCRWRFKVSYLAPARPTYAPVRVLVYAVNSEIGATIY